MDNDLGELELDLLQNNVKSLEGEKVKYIYQARVRLLTFTEDKKIIRGGVFLSKTKETSIFDFYPTDCSSGYSRGEWCTQVKKELLWKISSFKDEPYNYYNLGEEGNVSRDNFRCYQSWNSLRKSKHWLSQDFNLVFLRDGVIVPESEEGSYKYFLKKQGEIQGILLSNNLINIIFKPIEERIKNIFNYYEENFNNLHLIASN